MKTQPLCA